MKIYFEDGQLRKEPDNLPNGSFISIVDAKYGYIANRNKLDMLNIATPNCTIYTNSVIALASEYCWNESLSIPELYIRAGKEQVFTRVDLLTSRELRRAHNLMNIYMANGFGNLN